MYGKDPTHIDRVGARRAREMALREVGEGAEECLVRLTFAPGVSEPIDVTREIGGTRRVGRQSPSSIRIPAAARRATVPSILASAGTNTTVPSRPLVNSTR